MVKPMAAANRVVFTIVPEGAGSRVTWAMDGQNNLMSKIMHVFMDFDAMVGGQFDEGLAKLKAEAEAKS
jgi:hypothetical protein